MATQTEAHIFLAEQRGRLETDFVRSYHTFNCGAYQAEGRNPVGALCLLNDDTLRPGASLTMQVEQPTDVILLPVVGGLEYGRDLTTGTSDTDFLEPGQVGILSLASGMSYTVSNPYETETINCLQVWLSRSSTDFTPVSSQTSFDLTRKNNLLPLWPVGDAAKAGGNSLFIGQYGGRAEGIYQVNVGEGDEPKKIFVFVLQGVLEVANRLLHEKDGLSLVYSHSHMLEFEALSTNAILLLIELHNL